MRIDMAGMRVSAPRPEVDAFDAPPSDSTAECALLQMCELYPERIGSLRLDGLLVFPEHQAIWRAMCRTHLRTPELDAGNFYVTLRQEMCAMLCRGADHARDREHCVGFRYLRVIDFGEHANPKDIPYWLARLERVRDARGLISDAQQIAEKAWRLDVGGARGVATRIANTSQSPRVWERTDGL